MVQSHLKVRNPLIQEGIKENLGDPHLVKIIRIKIIRIKIRGKNFDYVTTL